ISPVANTTVLSFRLVVSDGTASSSPAIVQLTLQPNAPQEARPGGGNSARPGGEFAGLLYWPGDPGDRCEIQASSNLVQWVTIGTNTVEYFRTIHVTDPERSRHNYRFFRARLLSEASTIPGCRAAPPGLTA